MELAIDRVGRVFFRTAIPRNEARGKAFAGTRAVGGQRPVGRAEGECVGQASGDCQQGVKSVSLLCDFSLLSISL